MLPKPPPRLVIDIILVLLSTLNLSAWPVLDFVIFHLIFFKILVSMYEHVNIQCLVLLDFATHICNHVISTPLCWVPLFNIMFLRFILLHVHAVPCNCGHSFSMLCSLPLCEYAIIYLWVYYWWIWGLFLVFGYDK